MSEEWATTLPRPVACPECHGEGTIEEGYAYPHNAGRDIGEIIMETVSCPECGGMGEIPPPEEEEEEEDDE